jgi:hypothetical protein
VSLQEFHRTPIRRALPSCSVRGHLFAAIAGAALAVGCFRAPPEALSETDAAAPPDPADAAIARQLLADPDFEERALDWTLEGNAVIGTEDDLAIDFPPASGELLAQLGRANDAVDRLRQAVTVPPWAAALTLAGQRCFVSDDTDPTADDVLSIALEDRDGNVLEQVYATNNADVGALCQWESFSLPAEGAHAGEDIVLTLTASTDALLPSVFWFDDLSLVATP